MPLATRLRYTREAYSKRIHSLFSKYHPSRPLSCKGTIVQGRPTQSRAWTLLEELNTAQTGSGVNARAPIMTDQADKPEHCLDWYKKAYESAPHTWILECLALHSRSRFRTEVTVSVCMWRTSNCTPGVSIDSPHEDLQQGHRDVIQTEQVTAKGLQRGKMIEGWGLELPIKDIQDPRETRSRQEWTTANRTQDAPETVQHTAAGCKLGQHTLRHNQGAGIVYRNSGGSIWTRSPQFPKGGTAEGCWEQQGEAPVGLHVPAAPGQPTRDSRGGQEAEHCRCERCGNPNEREHQKEGEQQNTEAPRAAGITREVEVLWC